ncbi:hypothetical protein LOAG_15811 [Loa loa]|uniref:Uncharacterized protein n=1 Tax=Loa loa TaxID=7209 RepID=A0A1S0TFB4_LOALO|nr:hypothetical protein LOAG_18569 [Loa loa]XP_003151347.1 hypothetical protein LOAG_15811 [Loa loa]EFO12722.1 hypothetical protein LOAG_15811 [Loa loa]EJD74062.1 hypothetical protein LOAG_18569 [Loa loa]
MHSRFTLPPHFISQMFFANITTVPASSSTLPSSSSSSITSPSRLNFDHDLIPYTNNNINTNAITITTTTAIATTTTTTTTTTNATTITDITTTKSMIQDNGQRLANDRRTSFIS